MHPSDLERGLSELRRNLEEILSLVNEKNRESRNERSADSLLRQCDDQPSQPAGEPELPEAAELSTRDELFDDALSLVTEFGQASPAMLQMWLSIDYGRATKILAQFETEGLMSPKGKVRHKAYKLRRATNESAQSAEP